MLLLLLKLMGIPSPLCGAISFALSSIVIIYVPSPLRGDLKYKF